MFIGFKWFDKSFAFWKNVLVPRVWIFSIGKEDDGEKWFGLFSITCTGFWNHLTVMPYIALFGYEHFYLPENPYSEHETEVSEVSVKEWERAKKRLYNGKRNRLNILFFFNLF